MTLTVMAPLSSAGRPLMAPSPRRNSTPSKAKVFFDELINVPHKQLDSGEMPLSLTPARPRIIYIRDFPTLAPTSSSWYPPLLSAVRQRRQGPLSRPTSPINSPIAIIFGMTPSLTSTDSSHDTDTRTTSSHQHPPSAANKAEWGEDEASDKARERRLKDRMRIWERSDKALLDQLPGLSSTGDTDASTTRPEIVVIGGPGAMAAVPPIMGGSGMKGNFGQRASAPSNDTKFFRTSILLPSARSRDVERSCRVKRRQEINELTMRMGIGAVGGLLGQRVSTMEGIEEGESSPARREETEMWNDWGLRIEEWPTVRQIADRAVGSVVATNPLIESSEKSTLDPTDIPWSAVYRAWSAQKASLEMKKAWTKQATERAPNQEEDEAATAEEELDALIERLKNEPDLDQHEYRLVSCIVDPGMAGCLPHSH